MHHRTALVPALHSLVAGLLLSAAGAAESWYVASTGDDANPGSESKPFKSIQKAADVAKPGDTVLVRSGTYRETVRPKSSGEAGKPIIYKPYQGEQVMISGTEPITGWKPSTGKIHTAPMPAGFYASQISYADQVFVDGEMMLLARWPNSSFDLSAPAKSSFTAFVSKTRDKATNWTSGVMEDAKLAPATDGYYVGAKIFMQPNFEAWSWTFSGEVTGQQGGRLTFRSRSESGKDFQQEVYAVGSRYYLFDKKELLDAPGEWWHDRANGALHLWTPDGSDPSTRTVEARKRDWAFVLDGLSHITIQGFKLFACTITTDLAAGNGVPYKADGSVAYNWRSSDSLPTSHHIVLDGLDAKYVSHYTDVSGHFFYQWGLNTGITIAGLHQTIQNCTVRYSAGNGIASYGRENKVLNNLIEDVSYGGVDGAGISTLGGSGTFDSEIAYNTIRRTGRSGIILRQFQNSDATKPVARVHHNDVSHFMLQDHDGGAVYTFGQDAKFARIDHNWFHDAHGFTVSGIYPDFAKNWIFDHNVIWGVEWAIHLEGAHESGVVNTICYNNTLLCSDIASSAAVGIGNGQAPGSVFRNNIVNREWTSKATNGGKNDFRDNLVWDGKPGSTNDPKLTGAVKLDFTLAAGSPARRAGKPLGTVSTEQPGNPAIPVTVPHDVNPDGSIDLGAYASGLPAWKAGSSLQGEGIKPPVAPTGLAAAAASATQVNLSWSDNSSSESGFAIERSESGGPFAQVALAAANTVDYYDMGLKRSTAYAYRVSAINSAGASPATGTVAVTTPAQTASDARIARVAAAPPVDGSVGPAWAAIATLPIARINDATLTGDADLSGSWRAAWNDTALYVMVEVVDNALFGDAAKPWWEADAVEIYVDADNSKRKTYDGLDDFQFGFAWGADKPALGGNSAKRSDGIVFTRTKTGTGYRFVGVLPWATITSTGKAPAAGSLIGFDVHLADNDGSGGKGKRAWFAEKNDAWFDPRLMGTVELTAP